MNCSLSVRQTASCILIMYFFWFLYSEPFWYYCKSPFCIDDTEFLHAGCPTNLPYLCPSHTHAQPFYGPFSITTRVSWCQKKSSSGLHGAREDNMRQTHRQSSGRHSIQINQRLTSIIPPFLCRMSFLSQLSQFILACDRHQISCFSYPMAWFCQCPSVNY